MHDKKKKKLKKFLFCIIILICLWFLSFLLFPSKQQMAYGVNFNDEYASFLKLDPHLVFTKILDDWGFKYLRLTAQWDSLEKTQGKFDFFELDWQMNEAAKRDARVILVVGYKTPRWPECHEPFWEKYLDDTQKQQALSKYITTVVQRYKYHPALEIWQVENEPFLPFGQCKILTASQLKEEIDLVRKIDNQHKILVTDSGELSLWRKTAMVADYFGTTLYRVVWNKYIGYWNYDWMIPAWFYRFKLYINGRDTTTAFVAELQAESWIPNGNLSNTSLAEQFKSMSIARLKKNIIFADRTGMSRGYLWGAEWWYWLEKQGSGEFAHYVKNLKKQ